MPCIDSIRSYSFSICLFFLLKCLC
jgi:hypothetical protein